MSYIKRFKEISSDDVVSCGGKGASLGELMRAGFPFANGFVLTIDAFGVDRVQREEEVYKAYDQLDAHYVAVRSSATKEDGIDDSFAGQFDTYLFVDREILIEKILACHASLESDRIQAYCSSKNINRSEIKVAVVIQKMVNSEVAGVVFTANPITSNTNEIIIEGGFGLGEAVVSGIITPDNYVRNKENKIITQKTIGQQQKKLLLDIDNGGIKEESIESTIQGIQKLSDKHITQLAQLSESIEKHYAKPMDIEWALEDDNLYILQARPITTIDIPSQRTELSEAIAKRLNKKYHYIHRRFRTPFYTHILRDGIRAYHNKDIPLDYACDIIYLNGDIAADDDQWRYHQKQYIQMFLNDSKSINVLYTQTYKEQDYIEDYYNSRLSQCEKMTEKNLIGFWQEYHVLMQKMLATVLIPLYIEEWLESKIREYLQQKYPSEKAEYYYQIATTSQKVGVAFQEEISLLDIAIAEQKGEDIQPAIQEHIREYGWTKNNSHDGTFKTKQDVLDQLMYMKNPTDRKKELKEYFQEVSSVVGMLHQDFKDDGLFIDILDTLQESIYFRSWRTERCYRNAYYMDPFFQRTAMLIELKNYRDIFYLTVDEIIDSLEKNINVDEIIDERKKGYVTFADNNSIITMQGDDVLQQSGQIQIVAENTSNSIQGQSAFKGIASGKVVVVTHKDQLEKIKDGDILVTTATTVNYIPYLKKVQAIVADEGGVLSHASVISRELKIPTIIGTINATRTLKDGDLIEVNATTGVVKIIEKKENIYDKIKNNTDRYHKAYAGYLRGIHQQGMAVAYAAKHYPLAMTYGTLFVNTSEKRQRDWCRDNNMLRTKRNNILEQVIHDPKYIDNLYQDYDTKNTKYLQLRDEVFTADYIQLPFEQIKQLLQGLYQAYTTHAGIGYMVDTFLTSDELDRLEEEIRKELGDKATKQILAEMTAPTYTSFVNDAELEKLYIVQAIKEGLTDKDIGDMVQLFVDKYIRLATNYNDYAPLTTQQVLDECRQLDSTIQDIKARIAEEQDRTIHNKNRKQELYKSLGVSPQLQAIIHASEVFTHVQDRRKQGVLRTNFIFLNFFVRLSGRIDKKLEYCMSLLPQELWDILDGKEIVREKVQERYEKGVFFIYFDDQYAMYVGDEIEHILSMENFYPDVSHITKFSGTTAYRGQETGIVRVLRNSRDISQFQEGEIMVTNQTTPEFVPAMRKSLAVITDQGGITCHAAIVARELKKPCIIGTKIATQVLKTGDLVEVDANSGQIKKISYNA